MEVVVELEAIWEVAEVTRQTSTRMAGAGRADNSSSWRPATPSWLCVYSTVQYSTVQYITVQVTQNM